MTSTEKVRAWRTANADKDRAASRKRYAANPEKRRAASRRWIAAHPDKQKAAMRRARGLPEPTRPMPAVCDNCGKARGKVGFHLDHDHATGKFRGWLCATCNLGIGCLGDSIEGLGRAITYLLRVE